MNLLYLEIRRNTNIKIFKTTSAICFLGPDCQTCTKKPRKNLSSGAAVVGMVHIPKIADHIADWVSHYQENDGKNAQSVNFCLLLQFQEIFTVLSYQGIVLPQLCFQNVFTCIRNRKTHLLAVLMYSHFGRNICKRERHRFKRAISNR